MIINKITENNSIILAVSGELTAVTSEQLNIAIKAAIEETKCLMLDFKELEYVASAGLRVILETKKSLDAKGGEFIIRNVCEAVMEVFEITGFSDILRLE